MRKFLKFHNWTLTKFHHYNRRHRILQQKASYLKWESSSFFFGYHQMACKAWKNLLFSHSKCWSQNKRISTLFNMCVCVFCVCICDYKYSMRRTLKKFTQHKSGKLKRRVELINLKFRKIFFISSSSIK